MNNFLSSSQIAFKPYIEFFNLVQILNLFLLIVIVISYLYDHLNLKQESSEKLTNMKIGLITIAINIILGKYFLIVSAFFTADFRIKTIPINTFTWFTSFLVVDLFYYIFHRLQHKTPLLWCTHHVHHSSQEFNLSNNLRISWFEFLHTWLYIMPPVLIGFSPVQVLVCIQIITTYQFIVHTKKIRKYPLLLEKILVSPSHHRCHHGINENYINKNFSGFFIFWDKIFNTFIDEDTKVHYGTGDDLSDATLIEINIYKFRELYFHLKKCVTIKEFLKTLLFS